MSDEIKPSFSLKYIVLTVLTTVLVSGIGLVLPKLYELRTSKELEVLQGEQIDVLNDPAFPHDHIDAAFYLKGDQKKKVATLFRKVVVVRNSGGEGAENILVSAAVANTNAHLVATPKVRTVPKEIVDAIAVTKSEGATENKQAWNISLLNAGESIIFEYFVYSEEKLSSVDLNLLARKKDWKVVNRPLVPNTGQVTFASDLPRVLGAPIVFLLLVLIMSVPLYRRQWNRRPDYREKYGTFAHFYNRHRPWDLYEPPPK